MAEPSGGPPTREGSAPLPFVDDRALARAMKASERASLPVAWRVLRRELGLVGGLGALLSIAVAQARGAPFRELGPAADRREALSRRQSGGAVLLHRALRRRVDAETAMAATREVVLLAGVSFLDHVLGDLDVEALAGGSAPAEERLVPLRTRAGRFFNAEGTLEWSGERSVAFTVGRCRFPALLAAVQASELAPLFCEVDRAYFTPERTPISLARDRTIAAGDGVCDFRFRV